MRNICLNGLDGTSLLNQEQSCQSSRLHCVVMAIDDFHNFKMMTRNKALKMAPMEKTMPQDHTNP